MVVCRRMRCWYLTFAQTHGHSSIRSHVSSPHRAPQCELERRFTARHTTRLCLMTSRRRSGKKVSHVRLLSHCSFYFLLVGIFTKSVRIGRGHACVTFPRKPGPLYLPQTQCNGTDAPQA